MTTRKEQKEIRKQLILEAGLDLFINKGFHQTKISDIARAAHMSTGLLFHYFDSKEALYLSLIQLGLEGTSLASNTPYEKPLEFFRIVAQSILQFIADEPFYAKMFVLMNQAHYNEFLPDELRARISQNDAIEHTARIIQAGQAEGSIRDGDPRALSVFFWMALQGIAEAIARNPMIPCPDAEWFVDIVRRHGAD